MRAFWVTIASLLLLAGCGADGSTDASRVAGTAGSTITTGEPDGQAPAPPSEPPPAGGAAGNDRPIEALLRIDVDDGAGTQRRVVVTCPDKRGANPVACLTLSQFPDLLEEVPGDRACAELYGGPETARVTGTLQGRRVSTTLKRTNSCEIERWDRAAPLLRPTARPQGPR